VRELSAADALSDEFSLSVWLPALPMALTVTDDAFDVAAIADAMIALACFPEMFEPPLASALTIQPGANSGTTEASAKTSTVRINRVNPWLRGIIDSPPRYAQDDRATVPQP